MRSKTPLVMLEQLLMLLVFALAAALCLRAFSMADMRAERSAARDEAILQVQQAAELTKYCRGDMDEIREILGGEMQDGQLVIPGGDFSLHIEHEDSPLPLLGRARVWAESGSGECLFEVTAAWQKEAAA